MDALLPGTVNFRGQTLLHGGLVEYIAAEYFRNIQNYRHTEPSFQNKMGSLALFVQKVPIKPQYINTILLDEPIKCKK